MPYGVASAALAAAILARGVDARACGSGGSGGGGGGRSGGGGGALGAVLGIVGDIISAAASGPSRSTPRDTAPNSSSPRTPSGHSVDPSPVEITYTEAAEAPRANVPPPPPGTNDSPIGRYLEASAGFAWGSIQHGDLPWSGWSQHPILGQQVDSYTDAPGRRLGMGRASMIGATLRFNVVLANILTIGPSVTFLQQVDTNATVRPGSMSFGAERIRSLEYGGQVGLMGKLGPISLRAELFVGRQNAWAVITGLGSAGCEGPPVVTHDRWVITPRAMITGAVARHVTIGAYAGVDTLHFGDWTGGVLISFHGGGFANETPDLTVP